MYKQRPIWIEKKRNVNLKKNIYYKIKTEISHGPKYSEPLLSVE